MLACVGMALTLSVSLAAPAQATSREPSPLTPLLRQAVMDPLVSLLPPAPGRYIPYTGTVCPGGEPECIDQVLAEMERRLDGLAAQCDHNALFALAYLEVTRNVKEATDAGFFADRKWLTQIDAVFAQYYFDTYDAYVAGKKVPKAWKIALDASRDKKMSGLGSFLIGMNAHINHDFPYVLAEVGLRDAAGRSHKGDHNAYNIRLDSMYVDVFDKIAARFDPTIVEIQKLWDLDDLGVSAIMRGWREMVWRHAEMLVAARTPIGKLLVQRQIENYAAAQAMLIRQIFTTANPQARDAFCAANG